MVLKHGQWRRAVQSYLATISFVDAHVGRLLDALDESEHADNTIVVLWGDHGWHLGQKQHWRKHALWEVTTRTTLIVSLPAPARRGAASHRPVSLIDLYPTLAELAGAPARGGLDGQSLVPLLENPQAEWPRPVLTTYGYRNHSVRTERWRYIEYHDGGRELYDHDADPNEWTNLASLPEYASVVEELAGFLPENERQVGLRAPLARVRGPALSVRGPAGREAGSFSTWRTAAPKGRRPLAGGWFQGASPQAGQKARAPSAAEPLH